MAVVEMMMAAGIRPDATINNCLIDAFSMDKNIARNGNPFDLLDWSKLQARGADGRVAAINGMGHHHRYKHTYIQTDTTSYIDTSNNVLHIVHTTTYATAIYSSSVDTNQVFSTVTYTRSVNTE
jgi:hypothetical protein